MKRFVTVFALSLCLVLCAFILLSPVTALAADTVASGSCGKTLTWSLDSNGLLTISGTGNMVDCLYPDTIPWYDVRLSIKEVRIPKEVSSIWGNPFAGCSNLKKIVVDPENPKYSSDSNGVLYNKGQSVLIGVPATLSGHYTVSDTVVNIQSHAFYGCSGITGITIPDTVTYLGNSVFQGCTGLTSIVIPESVIYIYDSMFMDCTGLKTVEIKSSVSEIPYYTFNGCSALTSVMLPDSVVKLGSSAFKNCVSLAHISLPKNLQVISNNVFEGCTSLGAVEIPNGVTTIDSYAFKDCTILASIRIPDSVTSLGREVFRNCSKMLSARISGSVGVVSSSLFEDCTYLATVVIEEGVTIIDHGAFRNCPSLTSVTLPQSLETIAYEAFDGCTNLSNITLGSNVKTIDSRAFEDCAQLKEIIIPDSTTVIGFSAFKDCTNLTSAVIGNGVTHIYSSAFKGCTSLQKLSLGDHITHISSSAFYDTALTEVILPETLVSISVSSFDYAELSNYLTYDTGVYLGTKDNPYFALVDVLSPNITSLVVHSDARIMANDVCSDTYLKTVTLSDSLIAIGSSAFSNSPYINYTIYEGGLYLGSETNPHLALIAPESGFPANFVMHSDTAIIADRAFSGRSGLKEITLSSNLKRIGDYTFYKCGKLASIVIPKGVTVIDDYAFTYCSSMTSVTLPASVTLLGEEAFASTYTITKLDVEDIGAWLKIVRLTPNSTPLCCTPDNTRMLYLNGTPVTDLVIPEDVTAIPYEAFYDCANIKTVTIADSVTEIGEYAFSSCEGITSVSIGKGVKAIQASSFSYCDALTDITVPGNVKYIGLNAFYSCEQLSKVVIGPGVQEIDDTAFAYCNKIESLFIGSGVTRIGKEAFIRATALKTLSIPATLKQIDYSAFSHCANLTQLYIEDLQAYLNIQYGQYASITSTNELPKTLYIGGVAASDIVIPTGITHIPGSAFAHCTNITSVTIPDTVKEIGSGAFYNCTNLKQVNMGKNVSSIGSTAFNGCSALTAIQIPQGVSVINGSTFRDCKKLASVTIPASVKEIKDLAFDNCDSLDDVYYGGTEANWKTIVIGYSNYDLKNAKFHYGHTAAATGVTRLAGADRYKTAFLAADQLKQQLGVTKFNTIVVASGTDFADALSGSYLAAVKDAPMLLVRNNKTTMQQVKDYIKANLVSGGTVYLLGGVNAVPKAMESGLTGFTVKRLGGNTRYDTNLLILKEAGVVSKDILICTGKGFADSLSASAAKRPILLVKDSLNDAQKTFLQGTSGKKYIIGGTSAVSTRIENQVKSYGSVERLGGATRYDTSVLVAKEFFNSPDAIVVAYAQNFPDGLSGGALAAAMDAPLILVKDGKQAAAVTYAKGLGIKSGFVLGGTTLISDKTVRAIFAMASGDTILSK